MANIEAELSALIKKKATGDSDIAADSKLADFGLDSLDVAEIVFDIEDKYRIQLLQNNEDLAAASFQDLCALVERRIAAKAG